MMLNDGWFNPSAPGALVQFAGIHVFVCIVFWLAHTWFRFTKYTLKNCRRRFRRTHQDDDSTIEPIQVPDTSSGGEFHILQTSTSEPAVEISLITGEKYTSMSGAALSPGTDREANVEESLVRGVRRGDDALCNV